MSVNPPGDGRYELRASVDGREVLFDCLELWWADAEPPDHEYPTFTLITSADAPGDVPRVEVECTAPEATTFRDLSGEEFALSPLASESPGGWVLVDLGRDFKSRGFAAREWVARDAKVKFDERIEDVLLGTFEASLERSAAKGGGPGAPIKLSGRFRAQAPRW